MRGVFVTGTDTGVGKTLVSAVLARAWDADYWKPVQTGLAEEAGDTATVAALAGLGTDRLHPPRHAYAAPLSPHAAAALEEAHVALSDFRLPATDRLLVVEGAGGVLVPLNDRELMIDLIAALGLPAVVAARSTLGTINHTLLTLEALRARKIEVLGVALSGPPSPGNRAAIEHFGKVRVLFEIPPLAEIDATAVERLAAEVPALPSSGGG